MYKKVMVSVKGVQRWSEGHEHVTEMIVEGRLECDGDKYKIEYDEQDLGMETGVNTHTVVNIADGEVTISRTGAVESLFLFKKGRQYTSLYRTPFGDMEMGVFSNVVDVDLNAEGGTIKLKYELSIGGKMTSINETDIDLRDNASVEFLHSESHDGFFVDL